jgi:hypothetical protein
MGLSKLKKLQQKKTEYAPSLSVTKESDETEPAESETKSKQCNKIKYAKSKD